LGRTFGGCRWQEAGIYPKLAKNHPIHVGIIGLIHYIFFFPPETPISLVPKRTGRNNNQFIGIFELLATFGTNQTSSQSPPAQALS